MRRVEKAFKSVSTERERERDERTEKRGADGDGGEIQRGTTVSVCKLERRKMSPNSELSAAAALSVCLSLCVPICVCLTKMEMEMGGERGGGGGQKSR